MNNILRTDSRQVQREIQSPHIDPVLKKLGPLPENGLFFGMADDDWPVLHDLDEHKTPYMVHAEEGWGKTHLLRVVLYAALFMRTWKPRVLSPMVLTNNLHEWNDFGDVVTVREINQGSVQLALQGGDVAAIHLQPCEYLLILIDGWEGISPELQCMIREMLPHQKQICTMITTRIDDGTMDTYRIRSGYRPGHFRTRDQEGRPLYFFVPGLDRRGYG